MNFTTLISTAALAPYINDSNCVIFDCRFELGDPEAGIKAYRKGHLPHAHYAHLEKDLSSVITETTGRHPLPDFSLFVNMLGKWGVNNQSQVIVYDATGGAFAARMWWLLRSVGHEKVAVLNGGINQWQKENRALTKAKPSITPVTFRGYPDDTLWLDTNQVLLGLENKTIILVDARTEARYNGQQEPIDSVAGHIPGALNRAFQQNLNTQGLFSPASELREQFIRLMDDAPAEAVVHMCGSGVTACHNLLAMEIAGLSGSKLYAGSWSEWILDEKRPIATA